MTARSPYKLLRPYKTSFKTHCLLLYRIQALVFIIAFLIVNMNHNIFMKENCERGEIPVF